jgi:ABC-type sugar transport system substrate-binding protein
VIPSTSQSENLGIWTAQLKATAEPFGWKVEVCNGDGNPATMERCGQTFVTQQVDAIVTTALGGPEIPNTFEQAKDANIPVIALGTSVNPGFEKTYDAVFADDIVAMGKITADYIAETDPERQITGLEITQNYGGQGYVEGVKEGLKAHDLAYKDLRDTNLADIVNSLKQTSLAVIRANPGEQWYITYNDTDASLYWADIEKAGREKDVFMITRYDNPSTTKLMRDNPENILVNNSKNWQHHFDMATALAAFWTDETPLPDPAETTNTPDAGVFKVSEFPEGSDRMFPFDPALVEQMKVWGETYKLGESTLKAP